MKNFVIFIFISVFTVCFFCPQFVNAATYKNGTLMPSTMSTQQVNKTNNNIKNDILEYNSTLSDQNKQDKQKNTDLKKQETKDKNYDPNPNWWRWENTNQGYTYFY